jgi:hypothetical protein
MMSCVAGGEIGSAREYYVICHGLGIPIRRRPAVGCVSRHAPLRPASAALVV